jgi:hypothetical protein
LGKGRVEGKGKASVNVGIDILEISKGTNNREKFKSVIGLGLIDKEYARFQ